jgi:hypothetical protein
MRERPYREAVSVGNRAAAVLRRSERRRCFLCERRFVFARARAQRAAVFLALSQAMSSPDLVQPDRATSPAPSLVQTAPRALPTLANSLK